MIKVDFNKEYILAGLGCSHTQGCAFTKPDSKYEWATEALQKKYKVNCNPNYITNNLTWMAKLKAYFNIKEIINYGAGGQGIDNVIEGLKNLSFISDLNNYIIIVQISSPYRKVIEWTDKTKFKLSTFKEFVQYPEDSVSIENFAKFKSTFWDIFHKETYLLFHYLKELYFYQKILEEKGAVFRLFDTPFFNLPLLKSTYIKKYNHAYRVLYKKMYKKPLNTEMSLILNKLNFLYTDRINELFSPVSTLDSEKLVEKDQHYSEKGNEKVANFIYESINKETRFLIKNNTYYLSEKAS